MFGENGLWERNHLDMENFKVPFIYYGIGSEPEFNERMKKTDIVTHYDLGGLIAGLFGLEIVNPGLKKGLLYANGVAAYGRSGYIGFVLNGSGSIENISVHK